MYKKQKKRKQKKHNNAGMKIIVTGSTLNKMQRGVYVYCDLSVFLNIKNFVLGFVRFGACGLHVSLPH